MRNLKSTESGEWRTHIMNHSLVSRGNSNQKSSPTNRVDGEMDDIHLDVISLFLELSIISISRHPSRILGAMSELLSLPRNTRA